MGLVGRPPKALKALQKQFCDLLRKGMHRPMAAAQVGLTEAMVSEWYAKGAKETKGIYFEFLRDVNKAESDFVAACFDTMIAHGPSDPKVLQWALSRRHPELFGRHDNYEIVSAEDRAAQEQATMQLLMERFERLLPQAPPTEPPATEKSPQETPNAPGV